MSSQNNTNSAGEAAGNIVRTGLYKKLKGSRKKFFVLRAETNDASACLEYYDNERKFLAGQPPKRSIPLKTCFNINRRQDVKPKHVIALYTKDDCFCVCMDSEEEVDSWLKSLLQLQRGEEVLDGEIPKPTFEHVWLVTVLNRGLGTSGLIGNYRLCLTDKTLTLIRRDEETTKLIFKMSNIRSCGSLKNFFFLEVGRSSVLGAGELWMETMDSNIAHNIHSTVFHAMSTNREDLGPKSRNRSSSATEASKPNTCARKQMILGMSKGIFNQDNFHTNTNDTQAYPVNVTSSSSQHPIVSGVASIYQHLIHRGASKTSERRHSISGGISWSGHASHQRTQSLPLAHPESTTIDKTSQIAKSAKPRPMPSSKCMAGGRERCDSMPSRARTSSEGNHPLPLWAQGKPCHLSCRPNSLYGHGRDISHSPPAGSPVSPPSVGCSTDSAGSSYSLADETETNELEHTLGRLVGHSLTPDEAIAEEDCPDSPGIPITISPGRGNYVPMAPTCSDDGYVDMSPRDRLNTMSPAASLSSVTSGTPSTDMKFAEYHLDKVSSYFPSEDDEGSSNDRPPRAYSFGSKSETSKFKKNIETTTAENARVRAFSVGSKTKKGPSRVLPPHGFHPHPGAKSSSAPILTNSKTIGSHGSIGPMDDLMELDFSRCSVNSNSGYVYMKPTSRNNSGYVEMKPGRPEQLKADVSPYVDMTSASSPAKSFISPQEEKIFVDINKQYKLSDARSDYLDMEGKRSRVMSFRCSTSPLTNSYPNANYEYLDMTSKRPDRTTSFNSQLSSSPIKNTVSPKYVQGSPLRSNYMDMQGGSIPKISENLPQTPDGYVEMSLGSKGHQRQSSLDSSLTNSKSCDDYTIMSLGSSKKKNNEKRPSKKDKKRSQPIMIQGTSSNNQLQKNCSPTSPLSSLLGRKYSTGTPPKMHLPLSGSSPYSSLPRQRSRKDSRRDSKDSSSSSVTTPSSSSTIFPMSLNSPSSPVKPQGKPDTVTNHKINITYKPTTIAKYGSNRDIENDDYTIMDFESNKPNNKQEDTSDYVNYNPAPVRNFFSVQRNSEEGDYAIMKPGVFDIKTTVIPSTTVNTVTVPTVSRFSSLNLTEANNSNCFRPISENHDESTHGHYTCIADQLKHCDSNQNGETIVNRNTNSSYETLCPGETVTKPRCNYSSFDLNKSDTRLNLDYSNTVKARPASVCSDGQRCNRSRPGSATSELCTCSSTSTLVGSRPESVNSDSIRPASVSSESQLHYASLDLPPSNEEDGARSPRTIKSSGHESGSKTQSEPDLTYAEIDFVRSQQNSLTANAKVNQS